jgi:ABC-type Na+ efflux pump permease subunit
LSERRPPRRNPRLRIAGRELASLRREKTIVLAIAIQLFVAAFSSFLVVGLVSLYDPGSVGEEVGIEFGVTGDAREDLAAVVDGEGREVQLYEEPAAARAAFGQGSVHAVLDARRSDSGQVHVTAVVLEGSLRTTLVVVQVKDVLSAFERQERAAMSHRLDRTPVSIPPETTASPYFGFTYTVLIPLLSFLPVFISGSVAVDSLVEELERGTAELLRVAPISAVEIVDGKLLATGLLAPVQAGAWLALLSANGTAIANPWAIVVFVAAVTTVVVALAAVVALAFPDRSRAQFGYSMGVIVLFGASQLLGQSPANAVARLAIGSPNAATPLVVAASAVLAVAAYLGCRGFVARSRLART